MEVKKKVSLEKQWIFNDGTLPIQLRIIAADEIHSIEHVHKTMHEYFYLLRGSMKIAINDEKIELNKDDLLVVEPGERHHIIEKSKDLLLLLLMPPPVPEDKIVLD